MITFDRTIPEIPTAIFNLASDDADLTYALRCDELWDEVLDEAINPEYLGKRAHHNVGTYDQGCRGPLCRKAHREHPRRKSPAGTALQLREERIYDPVIEYFYVVVKHRIRTAQQELLKELA
jgi:hypothetical protein